MLRKPFAEVVHMVAVVLQRHGLFRLKDYIATRQSGYVNGDPKPRVEDVAPGFVRVNADNGFAQIALEDAFDSVVQKARANGVAVLAIRNSHHSGSLSLDVERFADVELVALSVVNSIPVVAAPGGHVGVYGTNPIAFAAPRASGAALVFDQASSTTSHGDVQLAARAGRRLPEGTGVDAQGHLTADPQAILDGGALCTFGGYKGASIALLVEILCAALVGADFSFEVNRAKPAGATTARTGQTFIVIDPASGARDLPPFAARVDDLITALTQAGQTRVPGDRRVRARQDAGQDVLLQEAQWQMLLAQRA